MEERERRRMPALTAPDEIPVQTGATRIPYAEILGNKLYLSRTILLLVVWFLGYVTVYAIAQGLTSLLDGLHYPPPESGMIAAFGTFGFILTPAFPSFFGGRRYRKPWRPIAPFL